MQDIDAHLKQLAITAQQHPPRTKERQKALNHLLRELQNSNKLTRPFRGLFQGMYEAIYAEATQRLYAHICAKIDQYDPNREVLQWANFLLRKRFFVEACREIVPEYQAPKSHQQSTQWMTLDDLETKHPEAIPQTQTQFLSEELKQCLIEDPEGLFQNTHISNYPQINFQFLAQRILEGYKWRELSDELEIPLPTLNSFYQRSLKKFTPKLQEYLAS